MEKDLCFNCGYPGHRSNECAYPFNPNRVTLRGDSDNPAKTLPPRGQKRRRPNTYAKSQPLHASSDDDANHDTQTTDESDYEPEQRANKRQEN